MQTKQYIHICIGKKDKFRDVVFIYEQDMNQIFNLKSPIEQILYVE